MSVTVGELASLLSTMPRELEVMLECDSLTHYPVTGVHLEAGYDGTPEYVLIEQGDQ